MISNLIVIRYNVECYNLKILFSSLAVVARGRRRDGTNLFFLKTYHYTTRSVTEPAGHVEVFEKDDLGTNLKVEPARVRNVNICQIRLESQLKCSKVKLHY